MSQIIAMWSGPRNLSTAMMRSFGARADCAVWDEPFFAPFLKTSGISHPGRAETLEAHETDAEIVAQQCAMPPKSGEPYYFQKHMPHHMLPGFSLEWANAAKHFFLIREPSRVISSYIKGRDAFTLDDLGFAPQRRLFEELSKRTGETPPVIDSLDILNTPEAALNALCAAIDIPFDRSMLSWSAGPRPEDGAWAPYWYASVEKSTGFTKAPENTPKVPPHYQDMLRACEGDYAALRERRLRV